MEKSDFYSYRQNILTYFGRVALHIIPAVCLGLIIDEVCKIIQDKFELKPFISIVIQISICVAVLYIIEKHVSQFYSEEWQGNTPGLFFFAFLFVVQFNLINNFVTLALDKNDH